MECSVSDLQCISFVLEASKARPVLFADDFDFLHNQKAVFELFDVEVVFGLEFSEISKNRPKAHLGRFFFVVGAFFLPPGPWGSGGVALGGASCRWSVKVRKDVWHDRVVVFFAEFDEFPGDDPLGLVIPLAQEGGLVVGVDLEECSGLVAFYIRLGAEGHENLDGLPRVSGFGGLL